MKLSLESCVHFFPLLPGTSKHFTYTFPLAYIFVETAKKKKIKFLIGSPIFSLCFGVFLSWKLHLLLEVSSAFHLQGDLFKCKSKSEHFFQTEMLIVQSDVALLWQSWNHAFQLNAFRKYYKWKYWREINILIPFQNLPIFFFKFPVLFQARVMHGILCLELKFKCFLL